MTEQEGVNVNGIDIDKLVIYDESEHGQIDDDERKDRERRGERRGRGR
jgi:hypothetical protein